MNKDVEAAWSKYDTATRKIKQQLNSPKGGNQAEKEYSDAYKALVRLGEVMPLKGKYRGR